MVEGFRRGDFTGLVSVAKFVKGFDVPDVLVGVDARPNSRSLAEVIQKLGRVMRSSPGKDKALWLCHAGNMAGWYDEIRVSRAERKRTSGVSTSSDYVRVMDQRLCQWLLCQANSYPVR